MSSYPIQPEHKDAKFVQHFLPLFFLFSSPPLVGAILPPIFCPGHLEMTPPNADSMLCFLWECRTSDNVKGKQAKQAQSLTEFGVSEFNLQLRHLSLLLVVGIFIVSQINCCSHGAERGDRASRSSLEALGVLL